MVASSRKNKSRQGITIRKNKQSMRTVEGSSSHLNRTESSHSNNVRSASNMIPCFPANNSTDAHHCDIVSSRSSPSHFTKDSPFNTFPSQNQVNYKKIKPLLGKSKRILFEKWEYGGILMLQFISGRLNQFLKLVYSAIILTFII
jgi:hypothetical protein